MKILVLGDSHSVVFSYANTQSDCKHIFDVCPVGGASARGLVNNSSHSNALNIYKEKILQTDLDTVILQVGECDLGIIIWYFVLNNIEVLPLAIDNTVSRLMLFADLELKGKFKQIIICGSNLPTTADSVDRNLMEPGRNHDIDIRTRTQVTHEYNKKLKHLCELRGYDFLDITAGTINTETGLIQDKFLHWDQANSHMDIEAVYDVYMSELNKILNQ